MLPGDRRSMGRLESWLAQWARCLCSICAMFAAAIATTLVVYYLSPAGSAKKNTMAAATVLIWIALGCLLWSLPPPETESVVNRRLFNRRWCPTPLGILLHRRPPCPQAPSVFAGYSSSLFSDDISCRRTINPAHDTLFFKKKISDNTKARALFSSFIYLFTLDGSEWAWVH